MLDKIKSPWNVFDDENFRLTALQLSSAKMCKENSRFKICNNLFLRTYFKSMLGIYTFKYITLCFKGFCLY